jgi:hypothetical protein
MAYQLNKTDGTLLTEIIDGKIDENSTNLIFIGRNYKGFGEFLNENFIKLLETFANTAPPSKPIKGQLWFDTSENRLKVYDGSTFRSTDNSTYTSPQPTSLVEGDIWIDSENQQMYFATTEGVQLVGPTYSASQLKSGQFIETIRDTTGTNQTITEEYINGSLVLIHSKTQFTPAVPINGFTSIKIGTNVSSLFDFQFYGTAANSLKLTDSGGVEYTQNDFLTTQSGQGQDTTNAEINFYNNNGIVVGQSPLVRIATGSDILIKAETEDTDIKIQVKYDLDADEVDEVLDAIHIDTVNQRVGIFKTDPEFNLDVTGDARITGNLRVEGETTSLDVSNLRVEDKLIELAITSDSTLLEEADVDGSGLAIRVSGDDKYWTWELDNDAWTSSSNIDIPSSYAYKINGTDVLTATSLAASVVNAPGLTNIGVLGDLTIDNLDFDGNRITSRISGLQLDSVQTISLVTQQKIANVAEPTTSTDVATKGYVDTKSNAQPLYFSLVIDGMGTGVTLQSNVATVLNELAPASGLEVGTIAKVYAVASSSSTDDIDVNTAISKTFTNVDSNGVQNQSVVEDFSIADVSTTITTTYTRTIMSYSVNSSNVWTYSSTVTSAV